MDNDDIIDFSKKTSEIKSRLISKKENKYNRCKHRHVEIDDHTKMLECTSCGYIMTPYDYVLRLAERETNIFNNLKYAKMEHSQLNDELKELKRKIKNAKAQLNRVSK